MTTLNNINSDDSMVLKLDIVISVHISQESIINGYLMFSSMK